MTGRKKKQKGAKGRGGASGGRIGGFFASVRERLSFSAWFGGERDDESAGFFGTILGWFRSNLAAVSIVLLVVMASVLLSKVRTYATGLDGYIVHPEVFRLQTKSPPWFTRADIESMRGALSQVEPFSVFHESMRGRLGAALEGNPWVRGVESVRRDLPNAVEVRLRVRKPIAWVEHKGAYHLVDRHCVRLPGRYPSPYSGFRYPMPVVRGDIGQFSPYPEEGKVWEDVAVQEGVAVALELYGLYNSEMFDVVRIDSIDVSNARGRLNDRDSEIILETRSGVLIEWGRSLLSREFGEIDIDHKLDNLRRTLMEFPRLVGLQRVRVQWDVPGALKERGGVGDGSSRPN